MAFSLNSTHFLPPLSQPPSSIQIKNPNYFPCSKFPKTQFPNLPKHSLALTHTSSTPPPPYTNNDDEQNDTVQPPKTTPSSGGFPPPLLKKRKRYRKEYPGESKGITEEMRFVAMKLRNHGLRRLKVDSEPLDEEKEVEMDGGDDATWVPTLDGFLKYLVDSKLVFDTIERVVEDSNDVSYAYFRRTGLERSESLARDLEWFGEQNMLIPDPSSPGVSYAAYLKDLSEKSAPLFLSHFYNIYFSHIAGGQVIAKQVDSTFACF
ncbi:hypothetical protein RND81_02G069500 [Saponaria officinalis]|uniref:Inactive heme oxygenase 2, chloroplastic n=1 Tax=Saponaria officinalis TaxID=3572 RepID=A0AAW1ML53_SAPOF